MLLTTILLQQGVKIGVPVAYFFSKIKIAANNSSKIFISCKKEAMQVL